MGLQLREETDEEGTKRREDVLGGEGSAQREDETGREERLTR